MAPPRSTRKEIVAYLLDARAVVEEAVRKAEREVEPKADVKVAIRNAVKTACNALRDLSEEEDHWKRVKSAEDYGSKSIFDAIWKVIRKSESQPQHFESSCLPLTERTLIALGYKPPEDARRLIEEARNTCDKLITLDNLNPARFDFTAAATDACDAVKRLAEATCNLSKRLTDDADDSEWWGKQWKRTLAFARNLKDLLEAAAAAALVALFANPSVQPQTLPERPSIESFGAADHDDEYDIGIGVFPGNVVEMPKFQIIDC